ncbi:MAG: polymer-forming cytoskeletal protein [bacterium]|nr:polymer-forming cytoskeletal protein [bacterium]
MALKGSLGTATEKGRRFTDGTNEFDTVIGPEAEVKGEIRGHTNVQVWGTVEGTIDVDGLFWLRATGKVSDSVTATDMVIEGEITGSLTAGDKVDLRPTSRVAGDITAATLAVAEGSFFEGQISMPDGNGEAKVVSYQEKRVKPEDETENDDK